MHPRFIHSDAYRDWGLLCVWAPEMPLIVTPASDSLGGPPPKTWATDCGDSQVFDNSAVRL